MAIDGIHQLRVDFEHPLLCHTQEIIFLLIGKVVFIIVEGDIVDVPLCRSRLHLLKHALVGLGAAHLFIADVYERVFFLEGVGGGLENVAIDGRQNVELPLFLGLRDNLIVTREKEITFAISRLFYACRWARAGGAKGAHHAERRHYNQHGQAKDHLFHGVPRPG